MFRRKEGGRPAHGVPHSEAASASRTPRCTFSPARCTPTAGCAFNPALARCPLPPAPRPHLCRHRQRRRRAVRRHARLRQQGAQVDPVLHGQRHAGAQARHQQAGVVGRNQAAGGRGGGRGPGRVCEGVGARATGRLWRECGAVMACLGRGVGEKQVEGHKALPVQWEVRTLKRQLRGMAHGTRHRYNTHDLPHDRLMFSNPTTTRSLRQLLWCPEARPGRAPVCCQAQRVAPRPRGSPQALQQ